MQPDMITNDPQKRFLIIIIIALLLSTFLGPVAMVIMLVLAAQYYRKMKEKGENSIKHFNLSNLFQGFLENSQKRQKTEVFENDIDTVPKRNIVPTTVSRTNHQAVPYVTEKTSVKWIILIIIIILGLIGYWYISKILMNSIETLDYLSHQ